MMKGKWKYLILMVAAVCCYGPLALSYTQTSRPEITGPETDDVTDPVLKQHLKDGEQTIKKCLRIVFSQAYDAELADSCIRAIDAVPQEWRSYNFNWIFLYSYPNLSRYADYTAEYAAVIDRIIEIIANDEVITNRFDPEETAAYLGGLFKLGLVPNRDGNPMPMKYRTDRGYLWEIRFLDEICEEVSTALSRYACLEKSIETPADRSDLDTTLSRLHNIKRKLLGQPLSTPETDDNPQRDTSSVDAARINNIGYAMHPTGRRSYPHPTIHYHNEI